VEEGSQEKFVWPSSTLLKWYQPGGVVGELFLFEFFWQLNIIESFVIVYVVGVLVSSQKDEEAIRCEVDLLEKEIVHLTGRIREEAREKYFKLLSACGKKCGNDEPIYLDRF
jgi:hypothetical protein